MVLTARQKVYKSYVRDYVQGKPHTSCICVGLLCAQNAEDFLQHTGVRLSLRNLNIEIELITQFLWQVWHNIETR